MRCEALGITLYNFHPGLCVCVCVCERERGSKRVVGHACVQYKVFDIVVCAVLGTYFRCPLSCFSGLCTYVPVCGYDV